MHCRDQVAIAVMTTNVTIIVAIVLIVTTSSTTVSTIVIVIAMVITIIPGIRVGCACVTYIIGTIVTIILRALISRLHSNMANA